jgi:beta-glucanase (GH16 family)
MKGRNKMKESRAFCNDLSSASSRASRREARGGSVVASTLASILLTVSVCLWVSACTVAAEKPAPRAARSVHLWYPAERGVVYYNEVSVEKSYPGSYFCVCGFKHGYFGIQELWQGRKVVLFSVWDPGRQNNPNAVPEDRRVKVLYEGQGVRVSRFGNEGTGGKSMFDYQWKTGETYKCMVKTSVEGDRTTYAAYFYLNEEKKWKHLATFQTITGGDYLSGYYSFVEDFLRNGESARNIRRAQYGNGWVKTRQGQWQPLTQARFTADRTPTMNIDAGVEDGRFFLQNGGDTENHTPLGSRMDCPIEQMSRPEVSFDDRWELIWADEFNYEGLADPSKWNYEVGFIRNREKQYYTKARPENARVENGTLIIESRKEKYQKAGYTSASLHTWHKVEWLYGRIEVRAKLPTGTGMWPAIWMLGTNRDNVGWPTCGEIDIMENVGFDPNIVHANIHTKAYNHVRGTNKGSKIKAEKPYEQYHLYAIEWYKDRIEFFLGDEEYFTFKNEETGNAVWPYDKPHYLILNAAIGGTWGGQRGIDDTIFPQKYYIDYVRVFKRKKD